MKGDRMSDGIMIDENNVIYDGMKMSVEQKPRGRRNMVMNVNGRKIRVTQNQFVLMYTYFSLLYKQYSEERRNVYGN